MQDLMQKPCFLTEQDIAEGYECSCCLDGYCPLKQELYAECIYTSAARGFKNASNIAIKLFEEEYKEYINPFQNELNNI